MDKLQQIKSPISAEFEVFKQKFDASLQSSNPLLSEVIRFIKQRKGKMMRPILALLMAKVCGKIEDSTYYAAISLELLHTASLVHDDVVDESDKRRGQSSVNAIYDNKVSVLVGDYLLATSLTNAAMTTDVQLVELVSRLGQALSEGEIIQLSNTNASDFSEDVYFDVIKKKTAALLWELSTRRQFFETRTKNPPQWKISLRFRKKSRNFARKLMKCKIKTPASECGSFFILFYCFFPLTKKKIIPPIARRARTPAPIIRPRPSPPVLMIPPGCSKRTGAPANAVTENISDIIKAQSAE